MKLLKGLIAATAVASAACAPITAQAATATGTARAIIITPFAFIHVDNMSFGTIVGGPTGGLVTIDQNSGTRTADPGLALLSGAVQRARFVGMGEENQEVSLTLSSPPQLSNGAGNFMDITELVLDGPATRTISGVFEVFVGGTLEVKPNQEPGTYSGQFTLTCDYL